MPHARAASDFAPILDAFLRERGASEVAVEARAFLVEGQATSLSYVTTREGCVGFLALGTGEVRDVDLALYSASGQPIAQDVGTSPFAYARSCTAGGVRLSIALTLYKGRGELLLFRVLDAPRELGRLPDAIPFAVAAGGSLSPAQEVGTGPDTAALPELLAMEEVGFAERGYITVGAPSLLRLQAGEATALVALKGGRCYRVVARAPFARGLLLQVAGPSEALTSARAPNGDRVQASFCARADGPHGVRLQARALRGTGVVRVFEHPDAVPEADPDAAGLALSLAELRREAEARGLRLQRHANAWVSPELTLPLPVELRAGECYLLSALSPHAAASLDLRLVDSRGRLLAHADGRGGLPTLYHCAAASGRYEAVLRSRGGGVQVSLWLGAGAAAGSGR